MSAGSRLPWAIAAIAVIAAIAAGVARSRGQTAQRRTDAAPMRFEIDPGVSLADSGGFPCPRTAGTSCSRASAATASCAYGIRSLDSLETRPLQGTEAELVQVIPLIFWSPDSRFIGFFGGGVIKSIERAGGVPQVVCKVPGVAVGGTWNRRGVILVGQHGRRR